MVRCRALGALAVAAFLAACSGDAQRSDAELRLTPQQAHGRRVYEVHCARCHYAYRSRDLKGPPMKGLYRVPYMPSGIPANDDRVREVILRGRRDMPAYDGFLTEKQMDDLLAYLHTL